MVARVLRGKTDADFKSLSDDPNRKLIFLIGEDGLAAFNGLSDREKLEKIGYTNDYVQHLKREGYKFKLAIFSQASDAAVTSTWPNTVALAERLYPSVATKLEKQLPNLEKVPFQEIQAQAPRKFAQANIEGPKSVDFIDLARLEKSEGKLWQVRAFLYHEAHLTDLYSGDGFTKLENGERGLKEYIGINKDLSALSDVTLVDLNP